MQGLRIIVWETKEGKLENPQPLQNSINKIAMLRLAWTRRAFNDFSKNSPRDLGR